ncbi:MAG: hypothetical protein ABIP35_09775 [Ginsengibacter sp.]
MEPLNEILEELKEISPFLAKLPKVNVFDVPENYFEILPEAIALHTLLMNDEDNNGSKFQKINAFQNVPVEYFNSLSDSILSKIKDINVGNSDKESAETFPLLASLPKKNVFSVPENYFENLSGEIISKLDTKAKSAKVISMFAGWRKYAAAAIVAGIIAISSLFIFNGTTNDTNDAVAFAANVSKQFKTPEQLEAGLAALGDEEIIKYLEKHGSILDNELLIKDVDVEELPAVTDYLLDENTLNKYLDKIDANASVKN